VKSFVLPPAKRFLRVRLDRAGRLAQNARMQIRLRIITACLLAGGMSMLCGCVALLMWSGDKEIGVIPREPGSNVVFRTVLPATAYDIRFEQDTRFDYALSSPIPSGKHSLEPIAQGVPSDPALPASSFRAEDKVLITHTNTSGKRTITLHHVPGQETTFEARVAPHSSATLYDGSVADLFGGRGGWFSVSLEDGRASCELHIEFSPAPTLPEPIRVFCWWSTRL
jgi:hypothetical protein